VGYGYGQILRRVEGGALVLDIDDQIAGHWLYVVRRKQISEIQDEVQEPGHSRLLP
jgi:hypothetical protein